MSNDNIERAVIGLLSLAAVEQVISLLQVML